MPVTGLSPGTSYKIGIVNVLTVCSSSKESLEKFFENFCTRKVSNFFQAHIFHIFNLARYLVRQLQNC